MQERGLEKRAAGAVRRKRMQDLLTVLLFMLMLPYTCSVVARTGSGQTVETLAVGGAEGERFVGMRRGQTRRLSEEDFLTGALAACIPAQYREEALKAQAVILKEHSMLAGKGGAGGRICVSAEESGLAWLSEEGKKAVGQGI